MIHRRRVLDVTSSISSSPTSLRRYGKAPYWTLMFFPVSAYFAMVRISSLQAPAALRYNAGNSLAVSGRVATCYCCDTSLLFRLFVVTYLGAPITTRMCNPPILDP